jgi:hypothetical protein
MGFAIPTFQPKAQILSAEGHASGQLRYTRASVMKGPDRYRVDKFEFLTQVEAALLCTRRC